jgi:hypothetical protein
MFSEIQTFLKRHLHLPKVYFARSVHDVEAPAIIFLPLYLSRLNCGLTGIVAYKEERSSSPNVSLEAIESAVLHLTEHTLQKVTGPAGGAEHYLGGEDSVTELQDLVVSLKAPPALYTSFGMNPSGKDLRIPHKSSVP